ncbi:ABC transporter permease [Chromobacterium amazonense]|uniref:ABC transporter permease n=1 Tax=Chromobacterium amazonense TaxID=1382803 RepID=A0A2S9X2A2_9NEIS|nr:FtsX-like permease family protein [Chromobacterium amazonense]PRP69852.1 ABC transporter permease [Chromobacterium amazonense]
MSTVKLAWRNLLRNRRRTLATLGTMVAGVVALLLFGGYNRTVQYGLQTSFVRGMGHLQIQQKDFFLYGSGNPAAYGIRDYQRVIRVVENDPILKSMLTVATPTLSLGGIAGHYVAGASRTVFAQGSEVDGQNRMRQWDDYHFGIPGKPTALTGSAPDAAVIGKGLARVLQLCGALKVEHCSPPPKQDKSGESMPADLAALSASTPQPKADGSIELLAATASGAPNVARLQVVKAQSMGVKELDDMFVSLHLAQAQRLVYGSDEPRVTAIALQLRHTAQIPAVRARLAQLFATSLKDQPLAAYDFSELQPQYGQITGMFGTIFGFLSILIGCVSLFTIANTMNMVVMERTVEIGTLRAMGLRRGGIQRLFLCEGVMLGALGSVCGIVLSLLLAALINHAGLTWLPPGQVDPSPIYVRLWGENGMMLSTALGLMLMAMLSAWWPARRAARAVIVDALRHA